LNKRTYNPIIISCFLLLFVFILGSCSTAKKIDADEKEKISALVTPKIDSMMQGFSDNDYQKFSEFFDPKLLTGMPESGFNDTRKLISEKIGNYQSYTITNMLKTQNFITVICSAAFDNEDKVTIRVIFDPDADYAISGLWFDSPELRK
jgi:hypothetical protein